MNKRQQIFTRQKMLSGTCRSRRIYLTAHKFDSSIMKGTLASKSSRLYLFSGEKL